MRPSIDELIRALPELEGGAAGPAGPGSPGPSASPGGCAPPAGMPRRLWALGGLHAKIGLAYLAYWVRGWARDAAGDERERVEAHLRAALALLHRLRARVDVRAIWSQERDAADPGPPP